MIRSRSDSSLGTAGLPSALACAAALAVLLGGCSSVESVVSGDKVDYKSSSAAKATGLDVPPDLTQLNRDSRYPQQGGSVSAATFQSTATAAAAPAATASTVAPVALGDLRIERAGNERWLRVPMPPEQLWPQLQAFWKERGFNLALDEPQTGVMETDWAENRAKLPNDFIRNTLGRVIDSLYSTGERDKFRTRVERTATGSEVYISHRGMEEVYNSDRKDSTVWQPRPVDPQLEAEFLTRLMSKLSGKDEPQQAKAKTTDVAAVAAATAAGPARARLVDGRPAATLQVDDGFDRAWRRVGLALDRSGFTVEDRDRGQGLFFVRYVDPSQVGKEEPGFFSRLFSFGKKPDALGPARYRVSVKGEGESSTVSVLNAEGAPENGAAGKRIVSLLLDDLK